MDDRPFYLAIGTLGIAAGAVVLDAFVPTFDVPGGLWGVLSATLGVIGAVVANRLRKGE